VLPDIKSQTLDDLQAQFRLWGQPAYRAKQLLEWIYVHRVATWESMSNLPVALRERLRSHYSLTALELIRLQGARDSTRKFLWRLNDHSFIESVLIPANPALYGDPSDRQTLCVSTQVGCAYGCKFCASGLAGWKRHLRPEEIVDQVLALERWNAQQGCGERAEGKGTAEHGADEQRTREGGKSGHECGRAVEKQNGEQAIPSAPVRSPSSTINPQPRLISNLVIMGMGEPLANYDNLLKALRILNAPWGGAIGARKITISTSGLAPQIRKLADEPLQFRLAISLHGATDATRNTIMPVNRKYPLAELAAACEYYQEHKGRQVTFEYILIAGVNDGLDQIKPLAALARRLHAKVNLIPYNEVEGLNWQRPTDEAQEAFLGGLEKQKVSTTLRREKGHDIDAACGQLRLKTERELAAGHRRAAPPAP
jgi:23S rRNA (adenine2503-C2)-methyltransferase